MSPFAIAIGAAILAGLYFIMSRKHGDVTGEDARKLVASGAGLLDVRSPGEFRSGHIAGAVNIPVQELAQRLNDVGARERPLVVYCMSGARSAQAKQLLVASGWTQVFDLGPMSRW
jgi:phage shock protein E